MNVNFSTCCLLIGCALLSLMCKTQKPSAGGPAGTDERLLAARVDSVLALMTLEEKIGQLTLFTTDWEATGPTIRDNYTEDIRKGRCGALFNSHTARFTRELQRIAVEETRLGIPLIFGYDVIHGYKTIFPIPLGETASWDLELIERSARIAGAEAAAAGLHWTFAPMADVCRDARWGRIMEGAGEDTWLGSRVAEARVRGFQGKGPDQTDAVLACVKHYAAYGAPVAGRDYNTVDMSERAFRETYLPPYAAAIREGAATVMTSFNDLDGVPASGSRWLLTDILRDELGFRGFVVTDYTSINEMVNHGVVANEKGAGELALNAGVDMDMQGAVFQRFLAGSVQEGKVSVNSIDQAVRRILRLKFQLGLFDDPYRFSDEDRERKTVLSAAHRQAARETAARSIVLLKNERQTLPLDRRTGAIAVIGSLADSKPDMLGAWSASGDARDCVTLLEGIRAVAGPSVTVRYAAGCKVEGTDENGFTEALALAAESDIVVFAIGEAAWMSGEAASRADIGIPGVQEKLFLALAGMGKPVVAVLMNGRPLTIPLLAERADAILETWFGGTEAGHAIADVLFGRYNPAGKLPVSFPRHVGQVPLFYAEKPTGRPFDPESKWTSKYIDQPNTPLYPFGFGLSYTSFSLSPPVSDKTGYRVGETVQVRVTVRNTGALAGEEVVQLYIRDPVASVSRPVKELRAFRKVGLSPGEEREIVFELTEESFSFYRRDLSFGMEPGDFVIMTGNSSADLQTTRISFAD